MRLLQHKRVTICGIALASLLAVLLTVNNANAALFYHWTGTVSTDMADYHNYQVWAGAWIPAAVAPTAADNLDFFDTTTYPNFNPNIGSGTFNILYIQFADEQSTVSPAPIGSGGAARNITGGGTITIAANGNIDTWAAGGPITFTNTTLNLTRGAGLYAGADKSGPSGQDLVINTTNFNMGVGGSSGTPVMSARDANITVYPKVNFSSATTNRSLTLDPRSGRTINLAGGVTATTKLTGITVNGDADGVAILGNSAGWAGSVTITKGILRINSSNSLGNVTLTTITGNTGAQGTLELAGTINCPENFQLNGRQGASALLPHIRNFSDNNILSGLFTTGGGGGEYNFESAAGQLTISGEMRCLNGGARALNLRGASNGVISGALTGDTDGTTQVNFWRVNKEGTGTWTLTNPNNTYYGDTDVNGGTLALTGTASIANSSLITVHSYTGQPNCVLDVSGMTGAGFVLHGNASVNNPAGTQMLRGSGHVTGNVTTSDTAILNPGIDQGTLHFDNAPSQTNTLSLVNGTTLNFDLSSTPTGPADLIAVQGNLSLAGSSNLAINYLNGYLSNGTYPLFTYGGTLTGSGSNISAPLPAIAANSRLAYAVKTGNDSGGTAHQVNLVVSGLQDYTWKSAVGNYNWELGGTANNWNSNDHLFYNLDSVTFDNLGANASDIQLTTTLSPLNVTFTNGATHNYTFAGAGALSVINSMTLSGGGTVTFANSGTNNFGSPINLNSGTLAFAYPSDRTLTNALAGTGALRQEAANVLTLSADNSGFAGTIAIQSGGTIKAGVDNALGGTATVTTIENGGTLDVNAMNLGDATIRVQGTGVLGLGAIVNSSSNVQYNALKNVVVTGNNVTFRADGDIVNEPGRWDIRDGSLSGSAGTYTLTKMGGSAIDLCNTQIDNNLGDIALNEGRLWFDGSVSTGAPKHVVSMGDPTKTVSIAPGAQLAFWYVPDTLNKKVVSNGGSILAVGGATFAGPITLASDTTIEVDDWYFNLTAPVTGASTLIKTGNWELNLCSNDNTYGATEIRSDWLGVGNGGTTGSLGTGDVRFAGGTVLEFNRNDAYTVPNRITGSGGEIQFNAARGVVTLTGISDYYGVTYINQGTVVLQSSSALGTSGAGNHTVVTTNTAGSTGRLVLDGSGPGGNLNISEDFTTTGFGSSDSGTMGFWFGCNGLINNKAGDNSIFGNISLTGGGGSTMIKVDGGTLTLSGAITNISSSRHIILAGDGDNDTATDGTITGVIQNGSGTTHNLGVEKIGSGKWVLTNANTYTGNTDIFAGTLAIVNFSDYSINNMSAAITVHAGATLDTTASSSLGYYQMGWDNAEFTTAVPQALYGTGTILGGIRTNHLSTISPSGSLPAGTMTISGGDLILVGGGDKLQFKLGSAGNDKIMVNQVLGVGGTLDVALLSSLNQTVIDIVPNGRLAAGTYTLVDAVGQNAVGGVYFNVSAADAVMRQSLSIDNSVSGKVKLVVTGNVADLTWRGASGSQWDVVSSARWNAGEAEKFYQGDAVTFDDTAATGNVSVDATVYPALITVNNATLAYNFTGVGGISGGTSITKNGTGTMTLTNANCDFTGQVNINGGVFKLGADMGSGAIGSLDGMTVVNGGTTETPGGTLDLNGFNINQETIHFNGVGANNAGAIVNTGATFQELNYVAMTGDATIGGTVGVNFGCSDLWTNSHPDGFNLYYFNGGGNALTKVGTNEVDFYNVDTGLGDINIKQGSIYFYGTATMGATGTVHLSTGGTLGLWNTTVTHAKPIVVESTGGGIDLFSGDATHTGAITLNGALAVTTEHAAALMLKGVISGDGGLTITNNNGGRLVLDGANTYSGPTTVVSGTLELTANGQIASSLITNNDVLQIDGGEHSLNLVDGTGTMYVLGSSTVTASSIAQDSLVIGGSAPAPAAAVTANPVPEPNTLLLLALAGGLLAWFRRRKA